MTNKPEVMTKDRCVVQVRITAEEKKAWAAMARKGGIGLSEMVRRSVNGGGVPMMNRSKVLDVGEPLTKETKPFRDSSHRREIIAPDPAKNQAWVRMKGMEPPAKDVLDAIRANVWLDPLGKGNVCYDCKVGEGEKHKGSCGYAARMAANTN